MQFRGTGSLYRMFAKRFFPFSGGAKLGPEAALLPSGNGLLGTAPSNTQDNAGVVFKFVP